MTKIEIYTTLTCPYCVNAKELLQRKGQQYTEIRVDQDPAKLQEMMQRCDGRRTVPQIIINGVAIGGYSDLRALEESGQLNNFLK